MRADREGQTCQQVDTSHVLASTGDFSRFQQLLKGYSGKRRLEQHQYQLHGHQQFELCVSDAQTQHVCFWPLPQMTDK